MRILVISFLILCTSALLPNCAYESNNACLSCYYGFELESGKCQRCSSGFTMVNTICVDSLLVQQTKIQQSQLNQQSSSSNSSTSWQSQGSTVQGTTTEVSSVQSQSAQSSKSTNMIVTSNQQASNSFSNSNVVTFDTSNSGVMYLLQLFGLNSKIPSNCETFTSDFKCVKCASGFILSTLNGCNAQFSSSSSGSVQASGSTSSTTSSSTTSSSSSSSGSASSNSGSFSSYGSSSQVINNDPNCQVPSQNGDGSCVQCYFRYYYSTQTKKCVSVNPLCATWNQIGSCLTCYSGYKLTGTGCSIDIKTSSTSQTTQSSPTYTSTQTTQIPLNNVGYSPILVISDPNCRTTGSNGICVECYYGFYFSTINGNCIAVSPQCLTWNSQGHCLSCYQGYVISGTQCVISGSYGSQSSGSSGYGSSGSQSSGSSGSQSSSTSGTVINTGINLISSDPNCKVQNTDGSCNQCYYSFYYDSSSTRKCISVNPLCRTWNNLGNCLSCYQGYNLTGPNCVIQGTYQQTLTVGSNDLPPANQDPYCNQYKDQVCVKCATRTYYDSSSKRCIQIDSNCKLWNDWGICSACYEGYYIVNQRECRLLYPEVAVTQLKSNLNSDVNCRASDSNGVCTQCIWRFVLNQTNKTCIKVNDLCKTWSETTALCTSCYGGYSLNGNGECKVSW